MGFNVRVWWKWALIPLMSRSTQRKRGVRGYFENSGIVQKVFVVVLIVLSQYDVVCTSNGLQCLGLGGNGLQSLSCGCPLTSNVKFRVHLKILAS